MIKTIEDLRRLIDENGGKITIGKLTISMNNVDARADIDIKLGHELKYWVLSTIEDTTLLDGEDVLSVLYRPEAPNKEQEKTRKERIIVDNKFEGMVEAYEKILIGREITIGK